MRSFLEWVDFINEAYGEGTDLLQTVSNILANCRSDPYGWLAELSKLYNEANRRGNQEVTRVMYELTQIATQFLNDVRDRYLDTRAFVTKPLPDENNPGYQQRYERFMQEAHQVLDRLRQQPGA